MRNTPIKLSGIVAMTISGLDSELNNIAVVQNIIAMTSSNSQRFLEDDGPHR